MKAVIQLTRENSEKWKTISEAVRGGWGPTLRYALIIAVPPAIAVAGAFALAAGR